MDEQTMAQNMNMTLSFSANESQFNSQTGIGYIVGFSVAFFSIGLTGILGNLLVVYVILSEKKMRQSLTNMLILNLAIADGIILVFGIPEIVLFMMNNGWTLGVFMCKFQRSVLVGCLYASVLTLVSLCIERYIAIVFPIKAHLLCTKRHTIITICFIWIFASGASVPTMMFNDVVPSPYPNIEFCRIVFPNDDKRSYIAFKYTESALFYILPMILQIICYSIIAKHLFIGLDELHENSPRSVCIRGDNRRLNETIKARRGVVKMLVASVTIYFFSYCPHQILLFYNTFSSAPFHETWLFMVCVTILAYVNSAANPVLYCIFSENFRRKFCTLILCHSFLRRSNSRPNRSNVMSLNSEYTILLRNSPRRGKYGISSV